MLLHRDRMTPTGPLSRATHLLVAFAVVATATVGSVALPVVAAPPAAAEQLPTTQFFPADGCQAYTVPDEVGQVEVDLVGGDGFPGAGDNNPGGKGGHTHAVLEVTPGQTLYAIVGGRGGGSGKESRGGGSRSHGGAGGDAQYSTSSFGGASYGGGGGGASFLSTDGAHCGTTGAAVNGDAVLAVAGGGGGGGSQGDSGDADGGAGGDAGASGGNGVQCLFSFFGGCSRGTANAGGGGWLHGGGGGGAYIGGGGTYLGGAPRQVGSGWLYVNGGRWENDGSYGGGGGGGWFGGGQGGNSGGWGGGGGGSSYVSSGRVAEGTTPVTEVRAADQTPNVLIVPLDTRKLAVSTNGTGSGTITSSAGGIDCGADCTQTYPTGTVVTLTVHPAARSRFVGWSTGTQCSGTALTCTFTMDKRYTASATFNQLRRLNLTVVGDAPTGNGTFSTVPAGFPCGAGCLDFDQGTTVTLTATPDDRSIFKGLNGTEDGCLAKTCTFTLTDRDRNYTGNFQENVLTVVNYTGHGTVKSDDGGIACGASCSKRYGAGATVRLTLDPADDYQGEFTRYPCEHETLTCVLPMNGSQSMSASFVKEKQKLTIWTDGQGSITTDVPGWTCANGCDNSWRNLEKGTVVTLRAAPVTGTPYNDTTFDGWSGDCQGTSTTCVVTLADAALNVTARYSAIPRYTLRVLTDQGNGRGAVSSDRGGITCGAIGGGSPCSADFYAGTVVTLHAAPEDGTSRFDGWTGSCTGTGDCVVTMAAARTVQPHFSLIHRTLTTTIAGNGRGTLASSFTKGGDYPESSSFSCPGSCGGDYEHGDRVTVTADPDPTSVFTGWTGDCTGTGSCTVTLDQARNVTATFTRNTRHVSVGIGGNGGGVVRSDRTGFNSPAIDCGTACGSDFDAFIGVTLTATPRFADSRFVGWTGACAANQGDTCFLPVSVDASTTALFELNRLTVATSGAGTGSVTCGSSCADTYPTGSVVTFTATPVAGSTFVGWSGCNDLGNARCEATIVGPRTVTARFVTTPSVHATVAGAAGGQVFSSTGLACG
ncbi:MAG: hypothetical protein AAGC49_14940, partial [Brevundimonas sp.]|nr:hypothetical protein [Pseudomonadota bacterium]